MVSSLFEVFKEKNARILFTSQVISQVCDKTMSIGLVWTITNSYSIEILPWFLFVSFLPHLLVFPITSYWIQKWTPLRTVIGADFFRGLVFLILFFIHRQISHSDFLAPLFVAVFFVGLGSAFFNPSILSLPPLLVSQKNIVKLNSLIDLCFSVSAVFAASLAILILEITSLSTLILINAIGFVFGAFYQMGIHQTTEAMAAQNATTSEAHTFHPLLLFQQLKGIFKQYKVIQILLLLFFFLNLVLTPLFLFLPWYAQNIFGGRSVYLAWLENSWALGSVIGGLGLVGMKNHDSTKIVKYLWGLILLMGVIFTAFSLLTHIYISCLVLVGLGVVLSIININILTYFQNRVATAELPALMSGVSLISSSTVPLSMIFSAFIVPKVHIPHMALACGVITLLLSFLFKTLIDQAEVS